MSPDSPSNVCEHQWSQLPHVERPAASFALFPPQVLHDLEFSGLAWVSAAIDRVCETLGIDLQPLPKGIRGSKACDPITRKLSLIDDGVRISRYGSFVFSKNKSKLVTELAQEIGGGIGEIADLVNPDKPGYPVLLVPVPIKLVIDAFHRGHYPGMVESIAPRSLWR